MVFQNDILAGSSGASGASSVYQIDQSIRYNEDDSPYIMRANPSDGSRTTFTVNLWFKVGDSGTPPNSSRTIFASGYTNGSTTDMVIYMDSSFRIAGLIGYNGANASVKFTTTRQFRDHSAWYNLCFVADTTNNTQSDRLRLYINGVRETDFTSSVSYPNQNDTLGRWGLQNFHIAFGSSTGDSHANISQYTPRRFFDGYLAEIVYIDGTALEPSNFSETNSSGIWIPKDPSGLTFGTLGAYLKGETSSNFGTDSSGNNQNFTASGLTSDDQKSDSPTNNHATWNPITGTAQAYSNGNLKASSSSNAWKGGFTTAQVPLNSGTWYYEIYVDSAGSSSGQFSVGWSESNRSVSDNNTSGDTEGWVTYALNGNYYSNGGNGSYGATYTTGNVIGCKIDTNSSTNNVEFYRDGASQGTISQAFNTGGTGFISPYILLYGTRNATARFTQSEWTQTPTGITQANAINTSNLGAE